MLYNRCIVLHNSSLDITDFIKYFNAIIIQFWLCYKTIKTFIIQLKIYIVVKKIISMNFNEINARK